MSLSIPKSFYLCLTDLNLYDPSLGLATQIGQGEYLSLDPQGAEHPDLVPVRLWTDHYQAYLARADLDRLQVCHSIPPRSPHLDSVAIAQRLPEVIAYAIAAGQQPNQYLWGGRLPPNFDCSGLVQAAFAHGQIVIPRDAYQQEEFAQPIPLTANFNRWLQQLLPGDLIFFGISKATHVAIYVGNSTYIHSSGATHGHNRIAIDRLWDPANLELIPPCPAKYYAAQLRGAGRICQSYSPIF
ncbi:MAG: C40 family peptidase [Pseudanabaenaceae cyanobacterium bins.68]|nr:C40 family peptidase [Pseudanabaenaceae cyanobacterium bins.68]